MTGDRSTVASVLVARVLGEFVVEVDGRRTTPDAWGHGSAQRLLKLLLVTPRHRLRRELAAEALWPGLPQGRAAANLRRALHFLARALDRGSPRSLLLRDQRSVGIAVDVDLHIDLAAALAALDRLDRALLLWRRGPGDAEWVLELAAKADALLAMPEWELLPDDPYEDWLAAPREQLARRLQGSLLAAARALADEGRRADALAIAERLLIADPADEDAHRLAIALYAEDGRAHAARRQVRLLRRSLEESAAVDAWPAVPPRSPEPLLAG